MTSAESKHQMYLCSVYMFAYAPLHMLFKIPTSLLQRDFIFHIMGKGCILGPVLLANISKVQYTQWIALELVDQQKLTNPQ